EGQQACAHLRQQRGHHPDRFRDGSALLGNPGNPAERKIVPNPRPPSLLRSLRFAGKGETFNLDSPPSLSRVARRRREGGRGLGYPFRGRMRVGSAILWSSEIEATAVPTAKYSMTWLPQPWLLSFTCAPTMPSACSASASACIRESASSRAS